MIFTDRNTLRESKLEILRIFSMFFIVLGHAVVHGKLMESKLIYNELSLVGLQLGSRIGVNCFVLISGYFMVKSKYKREKLNFLIIQIFSYSIIITGGLMIMGIIPFSIKNIIYATLPIITSQYWFATAYVLLYLFTPYLQIMVNTITQKQHFILICIMLTVWSVIPTLLIGNPGYSNLSWIICLWLIAAYIRLYYDNIASVKVWHGVLFLFVIIGITVFIYYIGKDNDFIKQNAVYLLAEMNKVPAVICSLLLFLGFKNLEIKSNYLLNSIASCTFGVYLLHDNPQIRNFLWEQLCSNQNYIDSPLLIVRITICVIIIFILGVMVEIFRKELIKGVKRRREICQNKYNCSNLQCRDILKKMY